MVRSMLTIIVLAVSVFLTGDVALGQLQQAPPRDRPPDPAATGSIKGRVVDSRTGMPLRRATVRLSGFANPSTPGNAREPLSASTDADGRYEIAGIPPGSYGLSASRNGYVDLTYGQTRPLEPSKSLTLAPRQSMDNVDFALPRGGVITGRVLDEYGEPVQDVQVMPLRMGYTATGRRPSFGGRNGTTNDLGEFRVFGLQPGDYIISTTSRSPAFPGAVPTDRSGYAPTYYPSTPNLAEAQMLRVASGQTLTDITVMLTTARVANVTGSVFGADGQLVKQGSVNVSQSQGGFMSTSSFGQIRPDGSFSVNALPPGEYRFMANIGNFQPGGPPPVQAMAVVAVNGVDIDNVRLSVPQMLTISGRVTVDPNVTDRPRLQTVRLMAPSRSPTLNFGPTSNDLVRDDMTFDIHALPGTVVIRVNGLPPGWIVNTIRAGGIDVTEEIVVTDNIRDVEIELTNRVSEIAGLVTTDRGEPRPDAFAVLFASDAEARKRPGSSGFVRSDKDGKFRFRFLRPGSYYIAAVEHVEGGQWQDPEYQEALTPQATRITIGEGETKTVDVRVLVER